MKIGTREFKKPNEHTEVIHRSEGPIQFTARAVLDFSTFEKLCPPPVPPKIQRPNQPTADNVADPTYIAKLNQYAQRRSDWLVLESLKATPNLVWETIKDEEFETWHKWKDELRGSFFTEKEIFLIFRAVLRANSLDEEFLDEIRKSFFLSRAVEQEKLSFQNSDQKNIQSGELAKG